MYSFHHVVLNLYIVSVCDLVKHLDFGRPPFISMSENNLRDIKRSYGIVLLVSYILNFSIKSLPTSLRINFELLHSQVQETSVAFIT